MRKIVNKQPRVNSRAEFYEGYNEKAVSRSQLKIDLPV